MCVGCASSMLLFRSTKLSQTETSTDHDKCDCSPSTSFFDSCNLFILRDSVKSELSLHISASLKTVFVALQSVINGLMGHFVLLITLSVSSEYKLRLTATRSGCSLILLVLSVNEKNHYLIPPQLCQLMLLQEHHELS